MRTSPSQLRARVAAHPPPTYRRLRCQQCSHRHRIHRRRIVRRRRRSHFKVVVVSDSFLDKRLVARHRLVNGVLADESGALPFHSLSIAAAKTPEEWGVSSQVPASPKCMGGDGSGLKR